MTNSALFWTMVISLVFPIICAQNAHAKRVEQADVHVPEHKTQVKDELWVVAQETDFGKHYSVCISKDSFKFADGHLVVLSTAPDWKVSLLNQRSRVFWTGSIDDFHGLKNTNKYNIKKLTPVKSSGEAAESKIAKQPVTLSEGDCQLSEETIKAIGFTPAKVKVATTTKVPITPNALRILGKIVGIDGLEGIPLEITATNKDEKIDFLKTQWCLNRELDKQTFEIPKSFWQGKSFNDVETQNNVVTLRSQLKKHEKPTTKN